MAYSRPSLSEFSNKENLDYHIQNKYFSDVKQKSEVKGDKPLNKKDIPSKRDTILQERNLKSRSNILRSKEELLNQLDSNFYKKESDLLSELAQVLKKIYLFYQEKEREMRRNRNNLIDPMRYKKMITFRVYTLNRIIMSLRELHKK